MKMKSSVGVSIMDAINTAIGASACIDFYAAATHIPTTGLLGTSSQILLAATAMGTRTANATTAYGTFAAMTGGTAASTGTVAFFAIKTATNATDAVFTGSVGTAASDINFNTVDLDAGDNIGITALTFTQNL
jgi:hypothetical protein